MKDFPFEWAFPIPHTSLQVPLSKKKWCLQNKHTILNQYGSTKVGHKKENKNMGPFGENWGSFYVVNLLHSDGDFQKFWYFAIFGQQGPMIDSTCFNINFSPILELY